VEEAVVETVVLAAAEAPVLQLVEVVVSAGLETQAVPSLPPAASSSFA
jgi:hypothetical protein